MSQLIIGLTGTMGAGKGEVARIIANRIPGAVEVAFADRLKWIARHHYGWNGIKDERGRRLLQEIGTAGRQYDDWMWVRHWLYAINAHVMAPCIIAPDVRYDNEAEAIIDRGGVIWSVLGNHGAASGIDNHESERGIDNCYVDHVINNGGSITMLADMVDSLIEATVLVRCEPELVKERT